MRSAGWRWVWNETAFGFFMLLIFPFAVAVFSCVVDVDLVKRAFTRWSKLTIPLLIFAVMIFVLPRGVYLDMMDSNRVRQPFMFRGADKMNELNKIHIEGFRSKDFSKAAQDYRKAATTGNTELSATMETIFLVSNALNVSFGIVVFCYILLAAVAGKIGADICNHLVFVLMAMAVWFPSRAYADWFINLTDFSWISTYAAAWVLVGLFVVAAVILALRMNEGSLYHRFVLPTGVLSAILGAIAALKPAWLGKGAMAVEGYDPIFRIAFATIVVGLLYYISSVVHRQQG